MSQKDIMKYMIKEYPGWISVGYINKKFGPRVYPKIRGLIKTNMLERLHIKNRKGLVEQVVKYNKKTIRG